MATPFLPLCLSSFMPFFIKVLIFPASLGAQTVKNLAARQETLVWSLSQEDPLEKVCLPTPVFLSGESHGQKNLVAYSPWDCRE